ncbi:DUF4221 family protein [Algoriphagus halophilus]|uniref:DUF4221 domain-containing protein n=1 Tax=Algoriphagus halophilus TaxID=226505 RepID=A0A1N6D9U0_9BACT|nr:DUF4221 family protein [Algoriphagus halophilus]SIN67497.1 protein of unknown function [Algoriphagus halophilus]
MRKCFLIFIFGLIALISCQNSKESASDSGLVFLNSQKFELDSLAVPSLLFNQVSKIENKEYLFNLNQLNNSLDLYDINSGILSKRISFENAGPNAIKGISGFYVHNLDSIFLFPKMSFVKTTLINIDGETKNIYSPQIPLENEIPRVLNHASTNYLPSFYYNGKVFFDQLTLKNTTKEGSINSDFRPLGYLDLESDSILLENNSGYPQFYLNKKYPIYVSVHSRILNNNNKLVYSWGVLDSLIVRDLDWGLERMVSSRSRFQDGDFPQTPNAGLVQELDAVISSGYYGRVVFDPFQKVYYRFYHIGRLYNPDQDNSITSIFKNDFSILVYDENLELLHESKFDGEVYDFYQAFVGENGLYLPRLNPFLADLSEDFIVCDIFRLK